MALSERRTPVAIGQLETKGRGQVIDLRDLALEMQTLAAEQDDAGAVRALEALAGRLLPRITDQPMQHDRRVED